MRPYLEIYFAVLGGVAFFLGLLAGTGRHSRSENDRWAHGIFAVDAWRMFMWIAAGWGGFCIVATIAVHLGWARP